MARSFQNHGTRRGSAISTGLRRAARSERGGLSLALGLPLRLQLLHPPANQLALQRAQVVDEELALQVIHLVLHADGEEGIRRFLPLPLAVPVRVLDDDVAETGDLLVLVGDRETALGVRKLALADLEH